MRRLAYVVIGILVFLLALFWAGFAALKSDAARNKIESALSGSLGRPVTLGGIHVTLLPTPALDARDVRVGNADSNAAPGLSLTSLHVVPRVSSFLPGRTMTIDRVDLRGLTIALRRDKTGKWLLPVVPAPTPKPPAGAPPSATPAVDVQNLDVREGRIRIVDDSLTSPKGGPTITTISDVEAKLEAVGGALEAPDFSGRLGKTTVRGSAEAGPRGATLHLSSESIDNADLPSLFALATIESYSDLTISGKAPFELTTTIAPDLKTFVAAGKASIERVKFGVLTLDAVSAPFRFEKGVFTLDPFAFTFYGGKQSGAVSVDLNQTVPSYSIRSTLTGLDVNRALSATTTMKDFLQGSADMTTNVKGSGNSATDIQRSLTGSVKFKVANGSIRMPLLAAINQALGITAGAGKNTKFQSFLATAAIGGGKARTDDLQLRAGELSVVGGGTLGFDQSLDFKLRALFSQAKSQELAGRVGAIGRLRNASGQIDVPLTVTGTATAPKTTVDVGSVAKKQVQEELQKGLKQLFK
jgi:uncharacterized protein involved in outer membrane biogenesis